MIFIVKLSLGMRWRWSYLRFL